MEIWEKQALDNPLAPPGLHLIVLEEDTIFRLSDVGMAESKPTTEETSMHPTPQKLCPLTRLQKSYQRQSGVDTNRGYGIFFRVVEAPRVST